MHTAPFSIPQKRERERIDRKSQIAQCAISSVSLTRARCISGEIFRLIYNWPNAGSITAHNTTGTGLSASLRTYRFVTKTVISRWRAYIHTYIYIYIYIKAPGHKRSFCAALCANVLLLAVFSPPVCYTHARATNVSPSAYLLRIGLTIPVRFFFFSVPARRRT